MHLLLFNCVWLQTKSALIVSCCKKQCSIDALLDKTITQMLFLQSVSEKAEKVGFFKFMFDMNYNAHRIYFRIIVNSHHRAMFLPN